MKMWMVVLCVAMVAALITIPCADAYWEITQLTSNDLDDQYPDINDSGWVTWLMRGAGGGAFKIFLHDGSEPHCIADEYVGIPHISNNGDVVWNHFREDDSGIVYLLTVQFSLTERTPSRAAGGMRRGTAGIPRTATFICTMGRMSST